MNTGRRNVSKEMIQILIALLLKSWSKPSALTVILESLFGKYLDSPEDNNARFQMKIVYDLLKSRFMYENKDKMDEVWINYYGMPFVQTLSDPKVVDGIKIKLFGTNRRKIILEGGLIVVDDGSGSGAAVRSNDAHLTIFETTSHYNYDHTSCTNFSSNFATSSEVLHTNVKTARISYPYTPLEIKVAKRRRKDIFKASSSIKKSKIAMPLSLSCTVVQCVRATGEQHELNKVNVTIEATAEEHNITVDNSLTTFREKEKVEPVSSGERKNYLFEGFNISDESPKKLTQLINDYSELIVDGLLKHHASRSSSEIQKLDKILPTYLDMSDFLDQKVRTDRSTIEAYRDKMGNSFDVQYVEKIAQQTIGNLDCDLFVAAYAEYLSDGLQVPNDGLDAELLYKMYASLLWKYRETKAQKLYTSDIKDPRRPKLNFIVPDEEQLFHIE
ncbi:hypothetical protein CQW23_06126 [Capsicum baccatum]|uniref:Ubiquitin-like protease family profile domain-containing protein n=1 Tax=Capsicum baccatum TaxID=33114 RepID=A0A2G2X2E2_CAPBA|nr:hypothetical protein CQW23_06126 [Capsicum baccatum]